MVFQHMLHFVHRKDPTPERILVWRERRREWQRLRDYGWWALFSKDLPGKRPYPFCYHFNPCYHVVECYWLDDYVHVLSWLYAPCYFSESTIDVSFARIIDSAVNGWWLNDGYDQVVIVSLFWMITLPPANGIDDRKFHEWNESGKSGILLGIILNPKKCIGENVKRIPIKVETKW